MLLRLRKIFYFDYSFPQVFWFGPCLGGLIATLVFEIVFVTQRKNRSDMRVDGGKSSNIEIEPRKCWKYLLFAESLFLQRAPRF